MRSLVAGSLILGLLVSASVPLVAQQTPAATSGDGPVLKKFASEAAFRAWLDEHDESRVMPVVTPVSVVPAPPPQSPPPAAADMIVSEDIGALPDRSITESLQRVPGVAMNGFSGTANPEITNNQTRGVDEGGIIKQIGRHLVVLQDGRVFSVDLGKAAGDPMRLAGRIDVYRNEEVAADWYDEMLVLGDRILVTAYNYELEASEITVIRMDPRGRLRREARYLISSNDYYSTENYATRMVGDSLVFYTPKAIETDEHGRFVWPRLRRADGNGEADKGEDLIGATDIYGPAGEVDYPVLHLVSVCPLKAGIQCKTTAFVGPEMREFYVTPDDAYLWVEQSGGMPWSIDYGNMRRKDCARGQYWNHAGPEESLLYRVPLDGSPIGAVAVAGTPENQFSFEARGGRFRAMLARLPEGCIDARDAPPLVLLDFPLSAFDSRIRKVAASAYTPLPGYEGASLENRFAGEWLLYGGHGYGLPRPGETATSTLIAVPLGDPAHPHKLRLSHSAARIEPMGGGAVITGYRSDAGLSISYVDLATRPRVASSTLLPDRYETEGRSHAFNATIRADGSGLMGIPTARPKSRVRQGLGWASFEDSDLSFIALSPRAILSPVGELSVSGRKPAPGYKCQVSCIDWYGNARPIFTGGRVFALMGSQLVEGQVRGSRVVELGRVDMTGRVR